MKSKEEITAAVLSTLSKQKIKFDENRNRTFINHMYYFYQRLNSHEKLNIKLEESILSQVDAKTWKQSQAILETFCHELNELSNNEILDEEIFLVATYLLT